MDMIDQRAFARRVSLFGAAGIGLLIAAIDLLTRHRLTSAGLVAALTWFAVSTLVRKVVIEPQMRPDRDRRVGAGLRRG